MPGEAEYVNARLMIGPHCYITRHWRVEIRRGQARGLAEMAAFAGAVGRLTSYWGAEIEILSINLSSRLLSLERLAVWIS